jgi:hypothetical protein
MSTVLFQRKPEPVQRRPAAPAPNVGTVQAAPARLAGSPGPAPRLSRPLSGAGTGHPVQLKTEITHTKGTYAWKDEDDMGYTETVGIAMEASLDPKDPKTGSGTDTSVQEELMSHLKGKHSGQSWIKGHLLNDNLGGRAIAENLYPITSSANGQHKNQVENHVKDLVKEQTDGNTGLPVLYNVQVIPGANDSATFHCQVWLGNKSNKVLEKNIYSKVGVSGEDARAVVYPTDEDHARYGSMSFPTANLPKGWGASGTGQAGGKYNDDKSAFLDEKNQQHATIK